MGLFSDLVKGIGGGVLSTVTGNPLGAISAGIGLIGSIAGGGDDAQQSQTTTTQRVLSPEQQAFLQTLQDQLGEDVFDTTGIVNATRDRIGNEASALRQSALQRLQRGGVSALQAEDQLDEIMTRSLRELGGSIADIELSGQQGNLQNQQFIQSAIGSLIGGLGATTQTGVATQQQPGGVGFSQLFGAGLQSLMNPAPSTKAKKPQGGQTFFNASLNT